MDRDSVSLVIADDGPGFAADVIDHIGEPYVTTRAPADGAGRRERRRSRLGFFIAKTLLERSQARVELSNRLSPAHGAIVRIDWPRDAMDREPPRRDEAAKALGGRGGPRRGGGVTFAALCCENRVLLADGAALPITGVKRNTNHPS